MDSIRNGEMVLTHKGELQTLFATPMQVYLRFGNGAVDWWITSNEDQAIFCDSWLKSIYKILPTEKEQWHVTRQRTSIHDHNCNIYSLRSPEAVAQPVIQLPFLNHHMQFSGSCKSTFTIMMPNVNAVPKQVLRKKAGLALITYPTSLA